jgi:hypothetical protein
MRFRHISESDGIMNGMGNPHVGQRVWADGLKGTFTVILIDLERGAADLQLTTDTEQIHARIPLSQVHPVGEDTTLESVWRIKNR